MDLQSIFYILAIVIMVLFLSILLAVIFLVAFMKRKIDTFKKNPFGKTMSFAANNSEIVSMIAMFVTSFIASRFKKKA